ncbi:MAG TPA: sulfur carrier protein ThiS [Jatrophihabitantaceae bacterium]|jgi:sulfur carrier protein|nr:sulfur carrier protein ThiS [Jatrophihabitantaceae bacterium]
MTITLNGESCELDDDITLVAFIESRTGTTRGSAVVVDDEVVPRGSWPDYRLRDGQRVELITAVQGG